MKKNFLIVAVIAIAVIFTSCEKKESNKDAVGQLKFSMSVKDASNLKSTLEDPIASKIDIRVETAAGELVTETKVDLISFNGVYLSTPISLKPGSYKLTKFIVLDALNNAIYAAPKKDSPKAYLVTNPLDIEFLIEEDITTKLVPEVLSTKDLTPDAFGYFDASFTIVKTFDFLISVFAYDEIKKNLELTSASLGVIGEGINYNLSLSAITNQITVKDGLSNYTLVVKKDGYSDQTITCTATELKNYFVSPLKVLFLNSGTISLQPGGDEVKDAGASLIVPDNTSGSNTYHSVYCWTQEGILNITRSFLEYDLSMISSSTQIASAKLTLYQADENTGWATSGDNAFYVEKITSEWDEASVTWNTMPTSSSDIQISVPTVSTEATSIEIDVTSLVADQIANPTTNHGFCFKLQDESIYKRFVWKSSDNAEAAKRPKLVITLK